jgi:hypothetical protein
MKVSRTVNLADSPTRDQLATLVTQCNGDAHHILWVGIDGEVHIDPLPRKITPAGFAEQKKLEVRFRLETFDKSDGHLGPVAAEDSVWMNRLYSILIGLWKANVRGYQYRS